MKDEDTYKAWGCNCSDFVVAGLDNFLKPKTHWHGSPTFKTKVEIPFSNETKESYFGFTFTTPNKLFKATDQRIKNGQKGKILKDPGQDVENNFLDINTEGNKNSKN